MGGLPGVKELPLRREMPDVMLMSDGRMVKTRRQWQERREEMKRILVYYAVGQMPPPPGNVAGKEVNSEIVLDGRVKYRLVHLTFGSDRKFSLNIGIFTPLDGGPFPAIILQGGTPPGASALPRLPQGPNQGRGEDVLLLVGPGPAAGASTPPRGPFGGPSNTFSMASQFADVLRRGYALVVFNPNDCAEDTTLRNLDGSWAFRNTRFYPAYPGYDWGVLAGWAWGASRVADYLETDRAIDKSKLIITGASRNGKSAMVAAAAPIASRGRARAKPWTLCSGSIPTGSLPTCTSFGDSAKSCHSINTGFSRSPRLARLSRSKAKRTRSPCRKRSGSRCSGFNPPTLYSA